MNYYWLVFLLLLVSAGIVSGAKSDNVINLLTVGSWGNTTTSGSILLTRFAADWVNNNTNLLPDATIKITPRNCGDGRASHPSLCIIETTLGLLEGNVTGVLSGAFTADQRVIQFASNAFGLPQISGAASGPLMSNKVDYPTYLRTSPSDELSDIVLVNILVKHNWKHVLLALEDADWGAGNKDIITTNAAKFNITVDTVLCPTGAMDFMKQAAYGKSSGINVIIPMLNAREAYIFLDSANKSGLVGPNYAWLVPLTVVSASPANVKLQAPHIDAFALRPLWAGSIGFLPHGGIGPLYESLLPTFKKIVPTITPYSWFAFDAVMAYAIAADNLMKRGISYRNGTALLKELLKTTFNGTTGLVYFNEYGDRQGLINIYNFNETAVNIVAEWDPYTETINQFSPFVFFGGSTVPPIDAVEACICSNHGSCDDSFTCVCNSGYSGLNCEIAKEDSSILLVILLPILGGIILLGAAVGIMYKRKHAMLIKDIADRQQSDIPRGEIVLQTRIGAGGAGEVYTAVFRGTEVAVKQILSSKLSQSAISEFKLECAIMCSLRHPNIVLFMGSCYDEKHSEMLLVMEYMQKGSLYSVLHDASIALPFALQVHLAYQTAQGINFLHQCNPPIIHGDMKSHNVLLDGKWCARISDFGVTKLAKISQNSRKASNADGHLTDSRRSIGTIFWAAPEVLNGQSQSKLSDVYSFGVVLFEIFHRRDPYPAGDPLYIALRVAKHGLRPTMDPSVPPKVAVLIEKCWAQNPSDRPTFGEITTELHEILTVAGEDAVSSKPSTSLSVSLVATEIDCSSTIWNDHPDAMKQAITMVNEMMRQQLQAFHGHETDYSNESLFITFTRLEDAVNWCLTVQKKLNTFRWPEAFAKYSLTSPEKTADGVLIHNGLRVNMGVHLGMPLSKNQAGPGKNDNEDLVNLLEVAQGGMIVVSSAVHSNTKATKPIFMEEVKLVKHIDMFNPDTKLKESTYAIFIVSQYSGAEAKDVVENFSDDVALLDVASGDHPHAVNLPSDFGRKDHKKQNQKPKWDIRHSTMELKTRAGKSFVCDVFRSHVNDREVAVKQYFSNYNEEILLDYKCNVVHATKFDHPNVVKYVALTTDPSVTLVQEYMAGGSLKNLLAGSVATREKFRIAKEVAEGMKYLASFGDPRFAIHPNFKTNNVLIGKNHEVKITDYALGLFYDTMRTITAVESVVWTAPEVFQGGTPTAASTVYAFGMMLWEIYTQKVPFEGIHPIKLISQILDGHRPTIPDDCPLPYKNITRKCWATDPAARPGWNEICLELQSL